MVLLGAVSNVLSAGLGIICACGFRRGGENTGVKKGENTVGILVGIVEFCFGDGEGIG
jgi:hypothetical protein